VLTKLPTAAVSLQILTMLFWSAATAQSLAQPLDDGSFQLAEEMLSCMQRLETNRRFFERECATPFSNLKQSDSCSDRCSQQSSVPQGKCVRTCDTCKQVLEGIAHLEQTCGSRD